ncbi:MAG TPA: glycine C-acetyltransferase [Devosia sp.]|nr:glycine C-acetyltransferase [Devosia sp.]
MLGSFGDDIREVLANIDEDGLTKTERLILGPQGGRILVQGDGGRREMLNLCANNYLGLADHPDVKARAVSAIRDYGYGMASVRFICGTQSIHRELEHTIAGYLGKEDAITFAACFDANGALFEPLFSAADAIISDKLNHASIIDGVRLSKSRRYRFENSDMNDLEAQLVQANKEGARYKIIITDGVFSMDGYVAKLPEICDLAEKYDAIVAVDDCHATGHLGATGRGTPELTGALQRVDLITGTFGKALGGGMGGFIAGKREVIDLLRQRARPYLFSNSLAPALVLGAIEAIGICEREEGNELRARLMANTRQFRAGIEKAGFTTLPGPTPIIPVMLGDARKAQDLASALDRRGVYVAGFFYPVVPEGKARIRTQMSAALTPADLDFAIGAFAEAGHELGLV